MEWLSPPYQGSTLQTRRLRKREENGTAFSSSMTALRRAKKVLQRSKSSRWYGLSFSLRRTVSVKHGLGSICRKKFNARVDIQANTIHLNASHPKTSCKYRKGFEPTVVSYYSCQAEGSMLTLSAHPPRCCGRANAAAR